MVQEYWARALSSTPSILLIMISEFTGCLGSLSIKNDDPFYWVPLTWKALKPRDLSKRQIRGRDSHCPRFWIRNWKEAALYDALSSVLLPEIWGVAGKTIHELLLSTTSQGYRKICLNFKGSFERVRAPNWRKFWLCLSSDCYCCFFQMTRLSIWEMRELRRESSFWLVMLRLLSVSKYWPSRVWMAIPTFVSIRWNTESFWLRPFSENKFWYWSIWAKML